MKTIVVDGKDAILGRLGSFVAKELLKGNTVFVINSESVVISGKKALIVERIKEKRRMGSGGSIKGPKYIRQSDRLLKRMIRGMLPWDRTKGREAHKRLRCYVKNGDLTEEQLKTAQKFEHRAPLKYTTLKEVTEALK
jgi:large subunit ribosomal protein L13